MSTKPSKPLAEHVAPLKPLGTSEPEKGKPAWKLAVGVEVIYHQLLSGGIATRQRAKVAKIHDLESGVVDLLWRAFPHERDLLAEEIRQGTGAGDAPCWTAPA